MIRKARKSKEIENGDSNDPQRRRYGKKVKSQADKDSEKLS